MKVNQINVKVETRYTFVHKGIFIVAYHFFICSFIVERAAKKGINNIKKLAENNPSFMYPKTKNS